MQTRIYQSIAALTLAFSAAFSPVFAGEFEDLKAKFDAGILKVEDRQQKDLKVWHDKYLSMLLQLKSKYAQAGELDPTLFVAEEIARFKADSSHPDPDKSANFPGIQRLQNGYLAKVIEVEQKHTLEMVDIGDQYKKHLRSLKVTLTQDDKLEEALLVRNEEKAIDEDPRFKISEELIAASRKFGTPGSPPTPKTVWNVIFKSSDPALWNTRASDGTSIAVPLSEVSDTMQFLRMTRTDTEDSFILPITKDQVSKEQQAGSLRWIGTGRRYNSGILLGLFKADVSSTSSRDVQFRAYYSGRRHPGWGFGITFGERGYAQGYTWNGVKLDQPTVFEIAVSDGPLSAEEQSALLDPGGPSATNPALEGDDIITLEAKVATLKGKTTLDNNLVSGINGDTNFVEWNLGTVKPGNYEVHMAYTTSSSYSSSSGTVTLQAVRDISRYRGNEFKVVSSASAVVKKKLSGRAGENQTLNFGKVQVTPLLKFQIAYFGSYYSKGMNIRWLKLKPVP